MPSEIDGRDYVARSYGSKEVGLGERPGVVVVDYQKAFTDPKYPLGGAPLVMRGVENTTRLLKIARKCGFPVAVCNASYRSTRDMPHWKVGVTGCIITHCIRASTIDAFQ